VTGRPAIVVLGPSGLETARRIEAAVPGARLHVPRAHGLVVEAEAAFDEPGPHLRALFRSGRPVLALCAAGIVIRLLAPELHDKRREPPVLAIAEDGSTVVPLLGGHHGANRLARTVAEALGGHAAITTAGDVRLGLALDDPPPGWAVRNPQAAKPVTAALLRGDPVALEVVAGRPDWLTGSGVGFAPGGEYEVLVTDRDVEGEAHRLVLHPRHLALGVGCERGVAPEELIALAERTLAGHGFARQAVACVVSLELKAAEPAIHRLAERFGVPARFFSAAALEAETPRLANPSAEVFAAAGCHGVAEGAALAAAGPAAELVVAKTRSARATCAIARAPEPIDVAHVGRAQGSLALVGIGPGAAAWRTAEADALLARAEDVVGYRGYLDLLAAAPAHQRRHAFTLGEEEQRCHHALELAAHGRRVVLIGSGDVGIYAMAALVLELLDRHGEPAWQRVAITVSPGISALQAAAARAGAPLGHDFCAISLSDLMTPWHEIERRLEAAAKGDFVVALYNPASTRRRAGLARALSILAAARPKATPVIHARNLARAGERVEIAALEAFDPTAVDMLSLLIVGSSRTRLLPRLHGAPLVYTPRGYGDGKVR